MALKLWLRAGAFVALTTHVVFIVDTNRDGDRITKVPTEGHEVESWRPSASGGITLQGFPVTSGNYSGISPSKSCNICIMGKTNDGIFDNKL
jgi:hypothetical protein